MTNKKVIITDVIDKKGVEILRKEADVIYLPEMPDKSWLDEVGEGHAILVRGKVKIDRNLIGQAKNLLVIAKHGVGVDNIDIQAATERGIVVVNTPAANYISVAEHALGLMLSLCRNICISDRLLRQGKLNRREDFTGVELEGKTLGVIGLGRIGSELARKCNVSFSMPIICFDPYVPKNRAEQLGYAKAEMLDILLEQSDFVAVCTPLTAATTNLIGNRELALMKKTSFLINTARGGIINEEALHRCLLQKKIAGAACDVFIIDPPPPDNPLLSLDNFIATPHVGGVTAEAMTRMATQAAEEILRVFQGQKPLYPLNPEVYTSK